MCARTCGQLNVLYMDGAGSKRRLLALKRELKGWEVMFERKHGHRPSKVSCVFNPVLSVSWRTEQGASSLSISIMNVVSAYNWFVHRKGSLASQPLHTSHWEGSRDWYAI